ncbi:MAG TPA: hypothetical protein VHF88_09435 [Thermoleophilaceae bacterium]|nr:hypothetical protein [Thermoleophilaceae bacterium]
MTQHLDCRLDQFGRRFDEVDRRLDRIDERIRLLTTWVTWVGGSTIGLLIGLIAAAVIDHG